LYTASGQIRTTPPSGGAREHIGDNSGSSTIAGGKKFGPGCSRYEPSSAAYNNTLQFKAGHRGGFNNTIRTNSQGAVISGAIQLDPGATSDSTIGGLFNVIRHSFEATIGGGDLTDYTNSDLPPSAGPAEPDRAARSFSVIGGGGGNTIQIDAGGSGIGAARNSIQSNVFAQYRRRH